MRSLRVFRERQDIQVKIVLRFPELSTSAVVLGPTPQTQNLPLVAEPFETQGSTATTGFDWQAPAAFAQWRGWHTGVFRTMGLPYSRWVQSRYCISGSISGPLCSETGTRRVYIGKLLPALSCFLVIAAKRRLQGDSMV